MYGVARQQTPQARVDWELRIYNPLLWMILDWQANVVCGSFVIEVARNLVLEIGITQEQYEKWIEMEMAEFLVLLQCRR